MVAVAVHAAACVHSGRWARSRAAQRARAPTCVACSSHGVAKASSAMLDLWNMTNSTMYDAMTKPLPQYMQDGHTKMSCAACAWLRENEALWQPWVTAAAATAKPDSTAALSDAERAAWRRQWPTAGAQATWRLLAPWLQGARRRARHGAWPSRRRCLMTRRPVCSVACASRGVRRAVRLAAGAAVLAARVVHEVCWVARCRVGLAALSPLRRRCCVACAMW